MKNFKLLIYMFAILGLFMTSCDPSVEAPGEINDSVITYLPLITLEGGDIVLDCDATSYTDPGAEASAGGVSIPLITTETGGYFEGTTVNGSDDWAVAYSAFNDDGIAATNFRQVLWPECNGDLVNSIAGMYTESVARNGSMPPGYENNGPLIIKDLGNDRYAISDAQGGWYEYGRGLGKSYVAPGMILKANNIAANDFTSEGPTTVRSFGGVVTFTSLNVDPATKTLVLTTDWSFGYTFKITLVQIPE